MALVAHSCLAVMTQEPETAQQRPAPVKQSSSKTRTKKQHRASEQRTEASKDAMDVDEPHTPPFLLKTGTPPLVPSESSESKEHSMPTVFGEQEDRYLKLEEEYMAAVADWTDEDREAFKMAVKDHFQDYVEEKLSHMDGETIEWNTHELDEYSSQRPVAPLWKTRDDILTAEEKEQEAHAIALLPEADARRLRLERAQSWNALRRTRKHMQITDVHVDDKVAAPAVPPAKKVTLSPAANNEGGKGAEPAAPASNKKRIAEVHVDEKMAAPAVPPVKKVKLSPEAKEFEKNDIMIGDIVAIRCHKQNQPEQAAVGIGLCAPCDSKLGMGRAEKKCTIGVRWFTELDEQADELKDYIAQRFSTETRDREHFHVCRVLTVFPSLSLDGTVPQEHQRILIEKMTAELELEKETHNAQVVSTIPNTM